MDASEIKKAGFFPETVTLNNNAASGDLLINRQSRERWMQGEDKGTAGSSPGYLR